MLSGSIQFSLPFQFKSNHAIFFSKQCFRIFLNDPCKYNTYIYVIYIHLRFIDHSKYALSYAINHSNHKSCISLLSYHFNLQSCISIPIYQKSQSHFSSALNEFNLCFRYIGYRNHRHGPAGLQACIKTFVL